jgi:hypothetical protein
MWMALAHWQVRHPLKLKKRQLQPDVRCEILRGAAMSTLASEWTNNRIGL